MALGKIKKLMFDEGLGLITTPSEDIWFHLFSVNGDFNELHEGQTVEFTEVKAPSGTLANKVTPRRYRGSDGHS